MKGTLLILNSRWKTAGITACLGASLLNCPAPTITLTPVADTTLSENYPDNNLGALPFANSGTTQNYTRNRALFRFELAGTLPAHAKITNADLILEVVAQSNVQFSPGRFNLHRVLWPWGEGAKISPEFGGQGQGSPATTNEASWNYRFAFTTEAWTIPGAAPTNDFVAQASSGVTVFGVDQSPYTIPPTPQLVADLQLWLDQPATNFGWLLVCEQESTAFTACRFGSREDPVNAPQLQIDYEVPPLIDGAQKVGNEFTLSFLAQPGLMYTVEYCDALGTNAWLPLAYVWTPGNAARFQVTDITDAPHRFYRLAISQ